MAVYNLNTEHNKIVQAREIFYNVGPSLGCKDYICIDPDRKMIRRFAKYENSREDGDNLLREFVKEYNERNGTNFNVLINYSLILEAENSSRGTLNGSASGILLEIK